jgi:ABC-2 type transport system ATP-binding protein
MIRTSELTRSFRERLAVERLTVGIEEGEIVGLLGPNGAGKTTTLRMIAGLIAPTSGTATVGGIDPGADPARAHETIGFLTEAPGFYERLTAEGNLSYFARFYDDVKVGSAVERSLRLVGLADRARDRVGTFSKGMKQRLALARALVHQPAVLLLDEPTAGLDPEVAKELRALIGCLRDEGRTVLLSTHNLTEAEALSDRIAVLRTRLVALDTPAALRNRQGGGAVRVRASAWPGGAVGVAEAEPYVTEVSRRSEEEVHFRLVDPEGDRPRLIAKLVEQGVEILEVSESSQTLEDVYLQLVREEET